MTDTDQKVMSSDGTPPSHPHERVARASAGPNHSLAFLVVHPDRQNRGNGSAAWERRNVNQLSYGPPLWSPGGRL